MTTEEKDKKYRKVKITNGEYEDQTGWLHFFHSDRDGHPMVIIEIKSECVNFNLDDFIFID